MTAEQRFVIEYLELCKKHGLQLEARDYEGMVIDEYSESEYSDSQALIRGVGLIPKVEEEYKPSPLDPILVPYTTPFLDMMFSLKDTGDNNFTWYDWEDKWTK